LRYLIYKVNQLASQLVEKVLDQAKLGPLDDESALHFHQVPSQVVQLTEQMKLVSVHMRKIEKTDFYYDLL